MPIICFNSFLKQAHGFRLFFVHLALLYSMQNGPKSEATALIVHSFKMPKSVKLASLEAAGSTAVFYTADRNKVDPCIWN